MSERPCRRILWNRRPADEYDGGDIDEIVLDGRIHVEQMDDDYWWIGITVDGGGYWAGNFTVGDDGRMSFWEQECDGFEWDRDGSHELTAEEDVIYGGPHDG